jgi:hypothetical protein
MGQYRSLDAPDVIMMISDGELKELVNYFNTGSKSKDYTIVLNILEEMLALEKIQPPSWGETKEERQIVNNGVGTTDPDPRFEKIAPDKYRIAKDIQTRESSVNWKLASRRFFPTVHHSARGYWTVLWRVRSRSKKTPQPQQSNTWMTDSFVLQRIMDLARAGQLNRFRRCVQCQKWLYANFKHQNYCSTKCQQKHYSQSPEWKAKRRHYMRGYRKTTTSKLPQR